MSIASPLPAYTPDRRAALVQQLAGRDLPSLDTWLGGRAGTPAAIAAYLRYKPGTTAHTLSRDAWQTRLRQVRAMWSYLGIGHTEVVALCAPLLPETQAALWASALHGSVLLVDPLAPPEEAAAALRAAACRVLVTAAPYPGLDLWARIEALRPEVPSLKWIFQIDPASYLNRWQRTQAHLAMRRFGKAEPLPGQQIASFEGSLARFADEALPDPSHAAGQLHFATGAPALDHAALLRMTLALDALLPAVPVWLWGEPLNQPAALVLQGLLPLGRGETLLCPTSAGLRDAGLRLDALQRQHPVGLVPCTPPHAAAVQAAGLPALVYGGRLPLRQRTHAAVFAWDGEGAAWAQAEALALPGYELPRGETFAAQGRPYPVETVLTALESFAAVAEAALVARPDASAGFVPVAFLQLAQGQRVDLPSLFQELKRLLPPDLLPPQGLRIVDSLPRTLTGAVDVARLQREEAARQG
ncbi:MAG: hypothetical protein OHK0039_07350 [Bacteroidia bacterium]